MTGFGKVSFAAGLLLLMQDIHALPAFAEVKSAWRPSSAYLLDRHGEVIHERRVDFSAYRRDWTPLAAVSPALIKAVLTAEDRRFYEHQGVDWRALGAALWSALTGGVTRGASTLSMQVAALLDDDLSPEGRRRGLVQKLAQIQAARQLEASWTKQEILETYINLVGFWSEIQGVDAAAQRLFDKSPSGLTQGESSVLAALLPAPNAKLDSVAKRACAIARAARFQVACQDLKDLAQSGFAGAGGPVSTVALAPHVAQRWLEEPGKKVSTTLDKDIQRVVLDALREQLRGLAERNVRDGAALVVDNGTGEVLAYVGSAGPSSTARLVDGVRAWRQAGSTLKPFLYELALEKRYLTAVSILDDSPIHLETPMGLYIPQNYDKDFKGRVSVRTALAGSLNVPAVRTLILTGLPAFHGRLRDLGYGDLVNDPDHYGYSLALGSAEVSLWDQVNAYRTLANGGVYSPLRLTPGESDKPGRQVLNPEAAFVISDILSDRSSRAVTFGLDNILGTPFWSAVKTGTSKDMRDNWCIGYTDRVTVGVWVGNFEGDSMRDVSGVTGAAPVWLAIMSSLHREAPSPPPAPPPGAVLQEVRFEPPMEPGRREWFLAGTEMPITRLAVGANSRPRIQSPPQGMIAALDPDIPRENQAILFMAQGPTPRLRWLLDGKGLATAERPYKWSPTPGWHDLALVDADGRTHDQTRFQVRGLR